MAWWSGWPVAARDHDTACVSCHTSAPYALARPALRDLLGETGTVAPEAKLVGDVVKRVTLWNETDPFYPDQTVGLPKTSESRGTEAVLNSLILASRDARGGRLANETRRAFENLWKLQFTRGAQSGAWAWLLFDLAPWESEGAAYFGAALAAVAAGIAPEGYAASEEAEEPLGLLRAYLLESPGPRTPFDRVMLLWASAELPGLLSEDERRSAIGYLIDMQNGDGGWSLTSLGTWEGRAGYEPDRGSDGYATGLTTYALLRAGAPPGGARIGRALEWLVRNQDAATGRWPSSSLNREREPESERGLFMSDAATAFAVLALSQARERP
jgi:squalene-hopene/tetraprenyl-beta-curcumene cyclase